VKHPDRHQEPDQPLERIGIRADDGGQLLHLARTIGQRGGDIEFGHHVQRLGHLESADQVMHLRRRCEHRLTRHYALSVVTADDDEQLLLLLHVRGAGGDLAVAR
jgi:hypothetical protein